MAEKNKIPEIRYKSFSEEWEECQLAKVADFYKGHGYSKNDLVEVGTPIILYGRLYTKYQTIIAEVDTFVLDNSGSIYSTGNEVIVPGSGETAEDIARASAVVKPGILLGGDLNVIYPNDYINSIFLAMVITYGKQQKELAKKAQGKSIVHLRNVNLKEVAIIYPRKEEQSQIVTFFKYIDQLFTLHQSKYNKLINVKKAMLEKMFPKNGADVPEIRFKGFSKIWEERKLGEVVDKAVDNRGKTPPVIHDGDYPLLEVASLGSGTPDYSKVTKYVDKEVYNTWFRAHIKKDDILFSTVGNTGLVSLMDDFKGAAIAQNIVAFRGKDGNNSKFLYAMLQLDENLNKGKRIEMGAVQPSIKVSQLVEVEYMISLEKEEQKKIGQFFIKLDNYLKLHLHELVKLKNIKKAMLEKMFV